MSKVAILTDTVTEMTQGLADEYNIKIAPINIIIDGKQHPEDEIDLVWYRSQIPKWKELTASRFPCAEVFITRSIPWSSTIPGWNPCNSAGGARTELEWDSGAAMVAA